MNSLWNSVDACMATKGKSAEAWVADGVSIDSRTIKKGDLYVAIKGESFDGHDFIEDAFKNGAAAAVISKKTKHNYAGPLLEVRDTLVALTELGKFARERSNAKIIAVTGSVGKTSVKNALAFVLGKQGKTHSTQGNLNNHIGLPLMLARMEPDCEFAVLEMGMNYAGEILPLTKLARPHVAVITTIEAVHMEFFNSVKDIVDAKSEIFAGVENDGTAVIPFDPVHYERIKKTAEFYGIKNIISFGCKNGADVRMLSFSEGKIEVKTDRKRMKYNFPIPGKHQALNSIAVLAAVWGCEADLEKAAKTFEDIKSTEGRGKIYELKLSGDKFSLIDDSYNASPASMRAAFSVLSEIKKKKEGRAIALLGNMLELGKDKIKFHKDLAGDLEANKIDKVFVCGDMMAELYEALPEKIRGGKYESASDMLPVLKNELQKGDIVLVKGSHGSNMWKLAEQIRKEYEK